MLHDQHCHTSFSGDSKASMEEYYKIALKNNTKYFVTTEHIEFMSVYNNMDWMVDYDNLKYTLDYLKNKYKKITPLLGVELGYRKDQLNRMKEFIKTQDFDIINMSIHDNGKYDYYMKEHFMQVGIDKMLKIYFDNILDALDNFTDFNVLSHFDYGFKSAFNLDNTLKINQYEEVVRKIFRKVIELNKALEVNIKVQYVMKNTDHLKTWLTWYKEEGGTKLTLSSDAHEERFYDDYYQTRKDYIKIIKECGFINLRYFVKRQEYIYNI